MCWVSFVTCSGRISWFRSWMVWFVTSSGRISGFRSWTTRIFFSSDIPFLNKGMVQLFQRHKLNHFGKKHIFWRSTNLPWGRVSCSKNRSVQRFWRYWIQTNRQTSKVKNKHIDRLYSRLLTHDKICGYTNCFELYKCGFKCYIIQANREFES